MATKIKRSHYADIYGPTTGDRVRLGDTALWLEVERDFAVYGDECKFGGGKVLRDGMGQAAGVGQADALDCVHHQRPDRRLHRHLQGRHRHQERPDRRHRQGRQSRRDGRRRSADDRRRDHRSHRRRGADRHRRRHRHPHPLHLPAAGLRRPCQRADDARRRRHRPGHGHLRHDLHARRAPSADDAPGDRRPADEFRLSRARATPPSPKDWPSKSSAARSASSCTKTGARRPPRSTAA